jgi:O-antigen/teichoic acid export membrane protein
VPVITAKRFILLSQAISAFCSFLFAIYVTRNFGASEYGQWSYTISMMVVMSYIGALGYNSSSAVYYSVHRVNKLRLYLGMSAGVLFASTLILSILFYYSKVENLVLVGLVWGFISYTFVQLLKNIANAIGSHYESAIFGFLLPSLLLLMAAVLGASIESIAALYSIGMTIISLVLYLHLAVKLGHQGYMEHQHPGILETLLPSAVMMLTSLQQIVLRNYDVLLVGYYLTEHLTGIYSVVVKMCVVLIFGLNAILAVMSSRIKPMLINNDIENLNRLIQKEMRSLTLTVLLVIFLFSVFGIDLLSLFDSDFTVGYPTLLILMTGYGVSAAAGPVGMILNCLGKEKVCFNISLLSLLICLILGVALVGELGLVGVAISSAVGVCFRNIYLCIYLNKNFKIVSYYRWEVK